MLSRYIPALATAPKSSTAGYGKGTNDIDLESRNNHDSRDAFRRRTDSVDDKNRQYDVQLTESKGETDDETGKWR